MSEPVLAEAIGPIDGANIYFLTPSAYWVGTVWAFVNGLLVARDGDDGSIELGGNVVKMRTAPQWGDTLHFYYQEGGPMAAPFPQPPRAYSALDLIPIPAAGINLAPLAFAAAGATPVTGTPNGVGAFDMLPDAAVALELVPTPLSAEDV